MWKIILSYWFCTANAEEFIVLRECINKISYDTGRERLKSLCDYWYSKLDAKYTKNFEKSISIAHQRMTIQKQQKAIAIWKKLLAYIAY